MFGSTLSRWTMLHFGTALAFFLIAQLAMVAGVGFPAMSLPDPATLAVVHLVTIGWLTVLMLGALHQFVPVITGGGAVAGRAALVSLVAIVIGLICMEIGFVALGGGLAPATIACLPVGGIAVLAGIVSGGGALARTLWQSRPLAFSAGFIVAGLVFLLVTVAIGISFGIIFAAPSVLPWPAAFTEGLHLHLLAGLIGWFTLTAIGVSYRLLSMFTLAPEERGWIGTAVISLSVAGLAATWLLEFAVSLGAAIPGPAIATAATATGLGLAFYLADMVRLYRARRRRQLELNTGMAVAALVAFATSLGLAVYAGSSGYPEPLVGAAGYLFLFGWLSGLGLSQLYKIIPFLTWLERYGSVLGKQPVPRVQDLVDERRDGPWFILYFAAVAFATLCLAIGATAAWRITVVGQLTATIMIIRALWLARHRALRQPQAAKPYAARPLTFPQPSEFRTMTSTPLSTLDVREILRAGGEPFSKIMAAVDALVPGQGLRLLATFKPVPLFNVMAQRGFGHAEKEIGGGDWEVVFTPASQGAGAGAQR